MSIKLQLQKEIVVSPAELFFLGSLLPNRGIIGVKYPFFGLFYEEIDAINRQVSDSLREKGYITLQTDGNMMVDWGIASILRNVMMSTHTFICFSQHALMPLKKCFHILNSYAVEQEINHNNDVIIRAWIDKESLISRLETFFQIPSFHSTNEPNIKISSENYSLLVKSIQFPSVNESGQIQEKNSKFLKEDLSLEELLRGPVDTGSIELIARKKREIHTVFSAAWMNNDVRGYSIRNLDQYDHVELIPTSGLEILRIIKNQVDYSFESEN